MISVNKIQDTPVDILQATCLSFQELLSRNDDKPHLKDIKEPYTEYLRLYEPDVYSKYRKDPFMYSRDMQSVLDGLTSTVKYFLEYQQALYDISTFGSIFKRNYGTRISDVNFRKQVLIVLDSKYWIGFYYFSTQTSTFTCTIFEYDAEEENHILPSGLADGEYILSEDDMPFNYVWNTYNMSSMECMISENSSFWHIDDVTFAVSENVPYRRSTVQKFFLDKLDDTIMCSNPYLDATFINFRPQGTLKGQFMPACSNTDINIVKFPKGIEKLWDVPEEQFNYKLEYSPDELTMIALSTINVSRAFRNVSINYDALGTEKRAVFERLFATVLQTYKIILNHCSELFEDSGNVLYTSPYGVKEPISATNLYKYYTNVIRPMR